MNNFIYKTGNILTPNLDENRSVVVCHQVNCQGVMGSGLAKQVRDKFPDVYSVYKDKCIAFGNENLGSVQLCSCLADANYIVANMFGQDKFGRDRQYTDYKALRKAFSCLAGMKDTTFRIPYKMGCGLGGGDWEEVQKIIKKTLLDRGCSVEIWKLQEK